MTAGVAAGVAAVVLAAGAGTRFAGPVPKLLAPLDGGTLVGRAVEVAHAAGLDETIVVWGAVDLAGAGLPAGVTLVGHSRWADGLASSLTVALDHARAAGHRAVVVGLADQPGLPVAAWRAVAGAPGPLAVATYGGRRGHPVLLARAVWGHVPVRGETGARDLLAGLGPIVQEVALPGAGRWPATDVDTVEDLGQWGLTTRPAGRIATAATR